MTPETPETPEPVATGDRRNEVWMEPDENQLVRVRSTFKPNEPLPVEMDPDAPVQAAPTDAPPVQDVAVTRSPESVWDARPAEET